MPRGRKSENQSANLHFEKATSVEQAASMLNVSERSVKHAKKIQREATPEVNKAVDRGELSLNAAVKTHACRGA
ncbi:hypothetical protein D3C81_2164870 [compost metagenome]